MEHHEFLTSLLADSGFKTVSWGYGSEIIIEIRFADRHMSACAQFVLSQEQTQFTFRCSKMWKLYDFYTVNFSKLIETVQKEMNDYQKFLDEEFAEL